MKRRFHIIAFVLFIIAAAGCGILAGRNALAPDKDGSLSEEPVATAAWFSDIYFWNPPAWVQTEGTLTGDITGRTGLALTISVPEDNGDSRLSLMLTNGNLPDIISITDKIMISHLVKSGKVWKLDDFLKIYAPDSHLLKDFPEDVRLALTERDGDWYAYPSHMQSKDNEALHPMSDDFWRNDFLYADEMTIIWNKSLLKRMGLTVEELKTEEQVLAAFEKALDRGLQNNGNAIIPLLIDGVDYQSQTLTALQNFFGAEAIDAKGEYQDRLLAPESRYALRFLNTAFRKGYLESDYFMIDNKQVKEYMASGRVLCFIGNVANAGINETEWYSTAPLLSSEGALPVLGINRQTSCGWISTFISKDCKNPQAVAKWLDYMTSDEGMLLSYYGYENVDYIINEEGLVEVTELGMKNRENASTTGVGVWWPFYNKDWYFSVTPGPEEEDRAAARYQILCALGMNELTKVYDSSLVDIPVDYIDSNSYLGDLETKIKKYKKSQITTVIMSETEEGFENQYLLMLDRLTALGINAVDNKKNEKYVQNKRLYDSRIEKINP